MPGLYDGREQTKAKHFILKSYLQALAFKILHISDLTYVDGFSGPWEERDRDFVDTSFKIALTVLVDAQRALRDRGIYRRIRCFFSERDPRAFGRLRAAVADYHAPGEQFEVRTYQGRFEDAVPEIQTFIGTSFPLVFIDPTGWTGYPLDRIRPLFTAPRCEVLVNFMYDHVNRFVSSDDPAIVASFDPILGGPGWRNRLDSGLPFGPQVEMMFRTALRNAGEFNFVVSTKIDKPTVDRPHFFIAYGTKSREGLKAFREVEFKALQQHERDRCVAKERHHEAITGQTSLFSTLTVRPEASTMDSFVREQMVLARPVLLDLLSKETLPFSNVVTRIIQPFMLRETNVKDLCVSLAKDGLIDDTWSPGKRKPADQCMIRLRPSRAVSEAVA